MLWVNSFACMWLQKEFNKIGRSTKLPVSENFPESIIGDCNHWWKRGKREREKEREEKERKKAFKYNSYPFLYESTQI